MNKLALVVIAIFLGSSSLAAEKTRKPSSSSDKFSCTTKDFDGTVDISVTEKQIRVKADGDLDDTFGSGPAKFDDKYKPKPQHKGAHRFSGSNDCGSYFLIIDKKMVDGKGGHMTFQQDCDSDGTGPSYINFSCS